MRTKRVTNMSQLVEQGYYLCGGNTVVQVLKNRGSSGLTARCWQAGSPISFGTSGEEYTMSFPETWVEDNHPLPICAEKATVLIDVWKTSSTEN